MTIAAAKEKLHDLIDHADEEKIHMLLSLFAPENEVSTSYSNVYDDATITMLQERSEAYHSGKLTTHTLAESMDIINAHRRKNDL